MAILRFKEIKQLQAHELQSKLNELRLARMKSQVTAYKNSSKTKELKRTIARILTSMNAQKIENNKKDSNALDKKSEKTREVAQK